MLYHRALVLSIGYRLMDLYENCLKYQPGATVDKAIALQYKYFIIYIPLGFIAKTLTINNKLVRMKMYMYRCLLITLFKELPVVQNDEVLEAFAESRTKTNKKQ